jgi:hypothetical protein
MLKFNKIPKLSLSISMFLLSSSVNLLAESPLIAPSDVDSAFPQIREEEQFASASDVPNKFADMAIELFFSGKILCLANPSCPEVEREKLKQRQTELEKEHSTATLERVVKGLWHKCNSDSKCPRSESNLYKAELDQLRKGNGQP